MNLIIHHYASATSMSLCKGGLGGLEWTWSAKPLMMHCNQSALTGGRTTERGPVLFVLSVCEAGSESRLMVSYPPILFRKEVMSCTVLETAELTHFYAVLFINCSAVVCLWVCVCELCVCVSGCMCECVLCVCLLWVFGNYDATWRSDLGPFLYFMCDGKGHGIYY